ncbi:hypothetical protein BSKO_04193 [Bryopsis sp. KO-2023]|nr:hypothetical protein BSKO_04193 [Bryopsis sp. KO-2023]
MFFTLTYCGRKGPLGVVWIASHLDKRIKRRQVFETSISDSVESILNPEAPFALRLSGQLLFGVVRLYARKCSYTVEDCRKTLASLNKVCETTTAVLVVDGDGGPSNKEKDRCTPVDVYELMTQEIEDLCRPQTDPTVEDVEYAEGYRSHDSLLTLRSDSLRSVDPMMSEEAPAFPDDIILEVDKFREVRSMTSQPDAMEIDGATVAPDIEADMNTPSNLKSPAGDGRDGVVSPGDTAPPPVGEDVQLPDFDGIDFAPDITSGDIRPDSENGAPVDVTMEEQNDGPPQLATEDSLGGEAPAGGHDVDEVSNGVNLSEGQGLPATPSKQGTVDQSAQQNSEKSGLDAEEGAELTQETKQKLERKPAKRRRRNVVVDMVDGRPATQLTGHSIRSLMNDRSSILVDRKLRRRTAKEQKIDYTSTNPWVNPLLRPCGVVSNAPQAQLWFARQVLRKPEKLRREGDQADSEELKTPTKSAKITYVTVDNVARRDYPGFNPSFDFVPSGPILDDPTEMHTDVPEMDIPHDIDANTPLGGVSGEPFAGGEGLSFDNGNTPSRYSMPANSMSIPVLGEQGNESDEAADATSRDDFTSRTQVVLSHLEAAFKKQEAPNPSLKMNKILKGKTRLDASRWFFECLVLNSRGCIQMEQNEPFGDISIAEAPSV